MKKTVLYASIAAAVVLTMGLCLTDAHATTVQEFQAGADTDGKIATFNIAVATICSNQTLIKEKKVFFDDMISVLVPSADLKYAKCIQNDYEFWDTAIDAITPETCDNLIK